MKKDKRMVMSVVWLIIGFILIGLGFAGKVDSFWNGMGSGLAVIGALQLLRYYRFSKNEVYREKMEVEINDERNHFIRNKAWAWAGYIFILVVAVLIIVFKVMGQELLSTAAAMAVCLMLVLYGGAHMILKRKY